MSVNLFLIFSGSVSYNTESRCVLLVNVPQSLKKVALSNS